MEKKNDQPISEDPLFKARLADLKATASLRCGGNQILVVLDELAKLANQSCDPEERKQHLGIRNAAGHTEGIGPPAIELRRIGPIQAGRTRKSPIRAENTDKTIPEALPRKATARM